MNENKKAILIAEDEEINRSILCEMLKDDYEILEAENGREAIDIIESNINISLILLDIHMPLTDGYGVMDYLQEKDLSESIPVIITTSDQSKDVFASGKKNRVADIVYKPFRASDIRKRVDDLIKITEYEKTLGNGLNETAEIIRSKYSKTGFALFRGRTKEFETWARVMDSMLPDFKKNNARMRDYILLMAKALSKRFPKYGITPHNACSIARAAAFINIGYIIIPDEEMHKKEGANGKFFVRLKKRPIVAGNLIKKLLADCPYEEEKQYAYDICKYLNERYDGKGYPEGLAGDEIPIVAQLAGIMYRYDAIRYPLRGEPIGHEAAVNRILSFEHRLFNPDLLTIFEEQSEKIERIAESGKNKKNQTQTGGK